MSETKRLRTIWKAVVHNGRGNPISIQIFYVAKWRLQVAYQLQIRLRNPIRMRVTNTADVDD